MYRISLVGPGVIYFQKNQLNFISGLNILKRKMNMFNVKQFAKNMMFEFDLATATIFVSAPQPRILCLNSPHKQNVWPKMVLSSTARPPDMRTLEVRTLQIHTWF